jgi:hypothetical protein
MIKVNIQCTDPDDQNRVTCMHNAWGIWQTGEEMGLGGHFLKAPIFSKQ